MDLTIRLGQLVMYAINWAHKVAGLEPPSNHSIVKSIVDAGA